MRKILYISGTRAEYGLMHQTLLKLKKCPKLEVEIAVTGMHLMEEFGKTIEEIKKDKFKIHKIEAIYKEDNKESMANFLGEFVLKLTKQVRSLKPDIILLAGDRAESLGGVIVGTFLTIPVVHIEGGAKSYTVDGVVRHAITKLSNIHLVGTKKSAERVIKLGEEPKRVFVVGACQLDSILSKGLISEIKIAKKYGLDRKKPLLIALQHPVSLEVEAASKQMRETMEAIKELGCQTIVVYPNADAGGREMIKIIEEYRKYPFIQIYKSIPHRDYLSLMKVADAIVGNSSSGIIESPSFYLAAVNIGRRQEGRERAENVIDTIHNKYEIKKAIKKAIYDEKFRKGVKRCKNPYDYGGAAIKIAKILSKLKLDKKLLDKKLTY